MNRIQSIVTSGGDAYVVGKTRAVFDAQGAMHEVKVVEIKDSKSQTGPFDIPGDGTYHVYGPDNKLLYQIPYIHVMSVALFFRP